MQDSRSVLGGGSRVDDLGFGQQVQPGGGGRESVRVGREALLTHLAVQDTTINLPSHPRPMLPPGPPPCPAPHHSPCVAAAVLIDVHQEGQRSDSKEQPEKHGQHVPCKPSTGMLHWGWSPAATVREMRQGWSKPVA